MINAYSHVTASLPCLCVSFFFDGHFGSSHFWLEPFPSKTCEDWVSLTSGRLIRWEGARREHGERIVAKWMWSGRYRPEQDVEKAPMAQLLSLQRYTVRRSCCLFPLTQQNLWLRPEHDVKLFGVSRRRRRLFSACASRHRALFDEVRVIAMDGYGEVSLCIISPFIHMVMNFANEIIFPSARRMSC